MSYQNHLRSADDLVTPYEETRARFIKLALEKNRQATPYVEEAKALKVAASKAPSPAALIHLDELRPALLTAAGISDKAAGHLREDDKLEAIRGLIEAFLEPAGRDFVDELVYRFLLTRGDALGGRMRNLAGVLAERKMTRTIVATLAVQGRNFLWLSSRSQNWMSGDRNDPDIELYVRGLHWLTNGQARTLIYNVTVPIVRKNVDLSLLRTAPDAVILKRARSSVHNVPDAYIALGELKGGIDPAGADEHWKTANSALGRIKNAFAAEGHTPHTFFVGAAIERAMATEIFSQLANGSLTNAANLTRDEQLFSLCSWLVQL